MDHQLSLFVRKYCFDFAKASKALRSYVQHVSMSLCLAYVQHASLSLCLARVPFGVDLCDCQGFLERGQGLCALAMRV